MTNIAQFYELLANLVCVFDSLLVLENKKLDAIAENNIELLEQYMKDEQALAMKLKGLDLKREKVQSQCGLEGLTLKDVIEQAEGEDKEKFSQAYLLLKTRTQEIKNVVSLANKYIGLHLHGIEQQMADLNGKTDIKNSNTEFKSTKV